MYQPLQCWGVSPSSWSWQARFRAPVWGSQPHQSSPASNIFFLLHIEKENVIITLFIGTFYCVCFSTSTEDWSLIFRWRIIKSLTRFIILLPKVFANLLSRVQLPPSFYLEFILSIRRRVAWSLVSAILLPGFQSPQSHYLEFSLSVILLPGVKSPPYCYLELSLHHIVTWSSFSTLLSRSSVSAILLPGVQSPPSCYLESSLPHLVTWSSVSTILFARCAASRRASRSSAALVRDVI